MKKILFLILFLPLFLAAQKRPDQQPYQVAPNDSNWEFYSQKGGSPLMRTGLDTLGKQFRPATFAPFYPTPTGNTQKNGFVTTPGDSTYYINRFGSAFLIATPSQPDADFYETGTTHPPYLPDSSIYSTGKVAIKDDYFYPGASLTVNPGGDTPAVPTNIMSVNPTEAFVTAGQVGSQFRFVQQISRGREAYLLAGSGSNLSIGHKGFEVDARDSVGLGGGPDIAISIEAGGNDVVLPAYPDVRDDGTPTNLLFTGAAGELRSASVYSLPLQINIPQGRVVYGGTSGVGVLSDTSFFWNRTLKRLGVGSRYPQYAIDVKGEDISVNDILIGRGPGAGNDQNTRVGGVSLFQNTTGFQNTAIGWGSMYANTTGQENTGIGRGSLFQNTTGYQNFAGGSNSLYSNTTGTANVAIGYASGVNQQAGDINTLIGHVSGYTLVSGSQNTIIGGGSQTGITTGNNNTILGANVMGLLPSLNKNIILADGEGVQRIRVLSNGNTGIGDTVPTQRLHVSGSVRVSGAYYDSANSPGTSGQFLKSSVTGTQWGADNNGIYGGSGTVPNGTTATMTNDLTFSGADATTTQDPPFRIVVSGVNPGAQTWKSTETGDSCMLYFNEGQTYIRCESGLNIQSTGAVSLLSDESAVLNAPVTIISAIEAKTYINTDSNIAVGVETEEITVAGSAGTVTIELDYAPTAVPSGHTRTVKIRNISGFNVDVSRGAQSWEWMTTAGATSTADRTLTPGQYGEITWDNTYSPARQIFKAY